MDLVIEKLGKEDSVEFRELIIKSFARDPLFDFLFGDDVPARDLSSVHTFVEYIFHRAYYRRDRIWGVRIDGVLAGSCIMEYPKSFSAKEFFYKLWNIPYMIEMIRSFPRNKVRFLNEYALETRKGIRVKETCYLVMIAVNPRFQGKGIGKALLNKAIGCSEKENRSRSIALDTEAKDNVPLYEHFGFQLEKAVSIQSLPVYCLKRTH